VESYTDGIATEPFENIIMSSTAKGNVKKQARFVSVLKDTNNKFTGLIESYKNARV